MKTNEQTQNSLSQNSQQLLFMFLSYSMDIQFDVARFWVAYSDV